MSEEFQRAADRHFKSRLSAWLLWKSGKTKLRLGTVGETGAAGYAHVVKNHVSDNLWGTTFQGIKFRGHGARRKNFAVILSHDSRINRHRTWAFDAFNLQIAERSFAQRL